VLYTVHFTACCLGGPLFPGHGVVWLCYRYHCYPVLLQNFTIHTNSQCAGWHSGGGLICRRQAH